MVRRPARLAALAAVALLAPMVATVGASPGAAATGDDTAILHHPQGGVAEEFSEIEEAADFAKLRDAYFETRLLAGDDPLTDRAGRQAAPQGHHGRWPARRPSATKRAAAAVGGPWTSIGPDPTVQVGRTTNTFEAVSGRSGGSGASPCATTARSSSAPPRAASGPTTPGTGDLDLAHAGHRHPGGRRPRDWRPEQRQASSTWAPARAPCPATATTATASTGPTDGGVTWTHVSGSSSPGSRPRTSWSTRPNANHLYVATLRGRGGTRRTTAADLAAVRHLGVHRRRRHLDAAQGHAPTSSTARPTWSWTRRTRNDPVGVVLGRRDLQVHRRRQDLDTPTGQPARRATSSPAAPASRSASRTRPAQPRRRSTPASTTSTTTDAYHAAPGLQDASTAARTGPTADRRPDDGPRQRPRLLRHAVLLRQRRQARPDQPRHRLRRSAPTATTTPAVRRHLPLAPTAARTWKSLGYDLHPDFHAIAFQPDNTQHIAIGNDGGVWQSQQPGRPARRRAPAVGTRTGRTSTAPWTRPPAALVHSHRPADHPVHLASPPSRRSRASTGAARRTTARCASPRRTTAGSTRRAVTAAR